MVRRFWKPICVFFLLILWACQSLPARQRLDLSGATFAGTNKCMACHEEHSEKIAGTLHWMSKDSRTPISSQGCETCHGPGSLHIQNQKDKKQGELDIISFGRKSRIDSAQQSEQCLQCHQKDRQSFQQTAHHRNDVSCASCHQVHGKADKQISTGGGELELCAKCHKSQTIAAERISHHPIREGKMSCSSCHDAHGSGNPKNLKAPSVNDLCFQCHTEKRGPHLWQHPPVNENCTSCHDPHGTTHNKMLRANLPYLCQQCHSNSSHPGTLYSARNLAGGTNPTNRVFADSCINCHSNIHGSNHPSGKSFMR